MSKVDIYLDYSKMTQFISDFEEVKEQLDNICDRITKLQDTVEKSDWLNMGHEQASLYLALLVKYSGYICGKEIQPNISAYGGASGNFIDANSWGIREQGEGHLSEAIEQLKKYKVKFAKFEKNGNGNKKADCVIQLDSIQ